MKNKKKILVIGDTIIDENIFLKAIGISLESPTMKTKLINKTFSFGGAANVAKFASKFGSDVTFLSSISKKYLNRFELDNKKIRLINFETGKNNIKSRFWISNGDSTYKYLQINDVNEQSNNFNFDELKVDEFDLIAFSDYRCGLINTKLIEKCVASGKVTYASSQISSKKSNYHLYKKITKIVCNENEASFVDRDKNICITLGNKGCIYDNKHYPSYKLDNVSNSIGAGDCFYAALLSSEDPDFANKSASKFLKDKND